MSPPMSARSIGTFIDSEPSTPAYSPRMDHDWDDSSLVLLRPMSTCSEPGSPSEPVWEMLKPSENARNDPLPFRYDRKQPAIVTREMALPPRIASPPTRRTRTSQERKVSIKQEEIAPIRRKEYSHRGEKEEGTEEAGRPTANTGAPLGKLASKMKSMLRRKSTGDKKKEKKEKEKDYYDPVEDVHWTEM